MKPYEKQYKTQDPRSKGNKKIKENLNMASKEKFNCNEGFISE